MQGLGNDYLYIYGEPEDPAETSVRLSDRHFGPGSDGMIWISPSDKADFRMRIFNADGSEAKMCGNGIRCVGKYVHDKGHTDKTELTVETLSGIKRLSLRLTDGKVSSVTVDMGFTRVSEEMELDLGTEKVRCTPVDVGNPHAVTFVEDAEAVPLTELGPKVEKHPAFPGGVNAEFVSRTGENALRMRVWERGSGETMACGTGACATLVAAVLNGLCDRKATLALNGGSLVVEWDPETNHVFQEGPAEFVFDAEYE